MNAKYQRCTYGNGALLGIRLGVRIILLIQIQASDVTHRFIATALFGMGKNDHTHHAT